MDFKEQFASAFAATACRIERIDYLLPLEIQLRDLLATRRWQLDWAVVCEVMATDSTTALISATNDAFVDLGVSAPGDSVGLSAPSLRILRSQGMLTSVISRGKRLTPLFRARSFGRHGFNERQRGFLPDAASASEFSLADVDYVFDS